MSPSNILTKIMNDILKHLKTMISKSLFSIENWFESFQFFSCENIELGDQLLSGAFCEKCDFEVVYFQKMCPIFVGSGYKFLSLSEPCLDLIRSPSLSMKIQIVGGNDNQKSRVQILAREGPIFLTFFFSFSNFPYKTE